MKFINECFFGEIEVKKSGFYAGLFPLEKEEDVEHYLEECKKKYREARHHCYAYIFLEEREGIVQEHKKQSDDGEPAKTAGMPILQRMEGLNLKNALLVVSRIFGGTLLGTGGLSLASRKTGIQFYRAGHSDIGEKLYGQRGSPYQG